MEKSIEEKVIKIKSKFNLRVANIKVEAVTDVAAPVDRKVSKAKDLAGKNIANTDNFSEKVIA